MRKKLLSLALALVMCLSLMPCAFAAGTVGVADKFTDVPADAWYLDELEYAVYNGYISGTSATTFSPDGTLTRGQFVTILGRMVGVADTMAFANALGVTIQVTETFSDVKFGSYYYDYVEWVAKNGVMNGVSTDRFSPDTLITVEQMGTALANYVKLFSEWNGCNVEQNIFKPGATYADASSISAWAVSSMETMQKCNLLVVDANGNVNPQKTVTRAECVVSIVRLANGIEAGVVPAGIQESDTVETAVKKAHDALWSAGRLNSNMTQKEKAEVYARWLYDVCKYDYTFVAPKIHTAYGALINGVAVCDGFTEAYNLLLKTEGIDCSVMLGNNHAWTAATLDGVLYNVDVTNLYGIYDLYGRFWMTPEEALEFVYDPFSVKKSGYESEQEDMKSLDDIWPDWDDWGDWGW